MYSELYEQNDLFHSYDNGWIYLFFTRRQKLSIHIQPSEELMWPSHGVWWISLTAVTLMLDTAGCERAKGTLIHWKEPTETCDTNLKLWDELWLNYTSCYCMSPMNLSCFCTCPMNSDYTTCHVSVRVKWTLTVLHVMFLYVSNELWLNYMSCFCMCPMNSDYDVMFLYVSNELWPYHMSCFCMCPMNSD